MKCITTWILVADGSQARLFSNDGPGHGVEPVSDAVLRGRNLPGREIMSDRPGRTFDSAGQGRHAKEPRTDPREVEKHRFADQLAAMLQDELNQGKFDRLVLVAPPKALGQLRDALPKSVSARVSAELAKDLTHLPAQELREHLGTVIAV